VLWQAVRLLLRMCMRGRATVRVRLCGARRACCWLVSEQLQRASGHGGAARWVRSSGGTARCSWHGKLACCVHAAADDFVLLLRDLLAACMLKLKGIGRDGVCMEKCL
jgi:hypothetical protein